MRGERYFPFDVLVALNRIHQFDCHHYFIPFQPISLLILGCPSEVRPHLINQQGSPLETTTGPY